MGKGLWPPLRPRSPCHPTSLPLRTLQRNPTKELGSKTKEAEILPVLQIRIFGYKDRTPPVPCSIPLPSLVTQPPHFRFRPDLSKTTKFHLYTHATEPNDGNTHQSPIQLSSFPHLPVPLFFNISLTPGVTFFTVRSVVSVSNTEALSDTRLWLT